MRSAGAEKGLRGVRIALYLDGFFWRVSPADAMELIIRFLSVCVLYSCIARCLRVWTHCYLGVPFFWLSYAGIDREKVLSPAACPSNRGGMW